MFSVFIALGSNLGDRVMNLLNAVKEIKLVGDIIETSYLYESLPMYEHKQPTFLNAVCQITTSLEPNILLKELKSIEKKLGRIQSHVNGPRLIDLDILLYYNIDNNDFVFVSNDSLVIPHVRIQERLFVLQPLCDINPSLIHPILGKTVKQLLDELDINQQSTVKRVFPFGRSKNRYYELSTIKDTLIAGILNVTPDSFSDGGRYINPSIAVDKALEMVKDGANIIDIGGESTRPGSIIVQENEELDRVIPVIRELRKADSDVVISIDTRNSKVAYEAILAGANIINDVSGGKHDPLMLSTAFQLSVPIILMHMRGTPQTMTSSTNTTYNNLIEDIANELSIQLKQATSLGIPKWMQFVDPGIGFSKTSEQNLEILKPKNIRKFQDSLGNRPLMIGFSRKRFISKIISESMNIPEHSISNELKDFSTIGLCCGLLQNNSIEILRVHNVQGVKAALTLLKTVIK